MPLNCGAVITCRESYESSICARVAGPVILVEYIDVLGVRHPLGAPARSDGRPGGAFKITCRHSPATSVSQARLASSALAQCVRLWEFGAVLDAACSLSGIFSHLAATRIFCVSREIRGDRAAITNTFCQSQPTFTFNLCESLIYGCVGTCELEFCCSSSCPGRPPHVTFGVYTHFACSIWLISQDRSMWSRKCLALG